MTPHRPPAREPDAVSERVAPQSASTQLAEVYAFVQSPETRAFAARQLTRLGLAGTAYDVDDLLMTVVERLARRLANGKPIGDGAPSAIARYTSKVIRNTAFNLLEARKRHPRTVALDEVATSDGDRSVDPALVTADDPAALDGVRWDDVRARVVRVTPATRPWVAAAALAHLAVDEAPDRALPTRIVLPAHPSPTQAADWASLQYAGLAHCFADDDTPAVRKRRSIALGHVHTALVDALHDPEDDA